MSSRNTQYTQATLNKLTILQHNTISDIKSTKFHIPYSNSILYRTDNKSSQKYFIVFTSLFVF